ncbi:MAG: transporter [Proteobacteria bacterium]|nr:transporter [Pseudomonadota bacterium]
MESIAMRVLHSATLFLVLLAWGAEAQELNPRAYWPAPNGTNALVLGYQRTSGDIVTDPSLPLTGVDSKIDFLQVSYQRTINLFGRSSNLQFNLPFSDGHTEGFVAGEFRTRDTRGVADARVRLSINLKGAPSLDRAAFRELSRNPHTIIGASLQVQAPTGDYDADKLINIGTNRWSVKPAIGAIWPLRPKWLLEAELGVWIYGDNDDFLGQPREQDPIAAVEVHLIHILTPAVWLALDANYYTGGRTTVGGVEGSDLQRNSRIGALCLCRSRAGMLFEAATAPV